MAAANRATVIINVGGEKIIEASTAQKSLLVVGITSEHHAGKSAKSMQRMRYNPEMMNTGVVDDVS